VLPEFGAGGPLIRGAGDVGIRPGDSLDAGRAALGFLRLGWRQRPLQGMLVGFWEPGFGRTLAPSLGGPLGVVCHAPGLGDPLDRCLGLSTFWETGLRDALDPKAKRFSA